jgi:hypothetical protein
MADIKNDIEPVEHSSSHNSEEKRRASIAKLTANTEGE